MRHQSLKSVLDARIAKGFGDYVAIITETPVNEDETLDEQHNAINLYAQNGKASLWCRYLVGDQFLLSGERRRVPPMIIPKGWPHPDIAEGFDFLRVSSIKHQVSTN